MRNSITFRLTGRYALFSDPLTKIGGEKSTLMLPTYQAIKGICESIYWKPSIIWFVDKICVVKPIATESKGIRPIKYGGGNDLAYYTYLSDVEYLVSAHFEWNPYRPDLKNDWNENKHYFIAKRSLEKGGRRDIYLGVRECQGYVEPCTFTNETSYYKDCDMAFGLQYHSLSYPDENGTGQLIAKFWNPQMEQGIVTFPRPQDCTKERVIRKMEMKSFGTGNFSGLEEEGLLEGYEEGDTQ